jgi:non-lysosomal glucosylceramidase
MYNSSLPNFFKCCLFNELYFISDGGTIWIDLNKNEKCFNDIIKEYGRFAYLEGHEYRLYNTYDVHFYASFALVQLWPKLQLSMQYDFAEAINKEIKIKSPVLYNGTFGIEKTKYSMPHDLGDPENLPWVRLNAYKFHDTKNWKDLNLEFILSIYRDYFYLNDKEFLDTMWPYVKKILITVQQNDLDGDGLIESLGEPDQTYDTWPVKGASAYCGGLHVASLEVACRIAHLLNDQEFLNEYLIILKNAKKAYDTKLWNGKYYNYDSTNNSIMSDMCCGHWYLRSSGFNYEAFEEEKIKSCLNTIFEFNVMQYANGKQGAVNGMKPNGKIDISSFQSEEMWIGVTDSVAALMIYEV